MTMVVHQTPTIERGISNAAETLIQTEQEEEEEIAGGVPNISSSSSVYTVTRIGHAIYHSSPNKQSSSNKH